MDYYKSGCGHKYPVEKRWGIKRIPNYLMYSEKNVEQIRGRCNIHSPTTIGMARLQSLYGKRIGTVWKKDERVYFIAMGWLISEEIKRMYEDVDKLKKLH